MTDPLLPGMELTLEQSAFQAPSVQVLHDRAIAQGQISNQQWTIVVGIFLIVLFALVVTLIASIRLMLDGMKYRKMMKLTHKPSETVTEKNNLNRSTRSDERIEGQMCIMTGKIRVSQYTNKKNHAHK